MYRKAKILSASFPVKVGQIVDVLHRENDNNIIIGFTKEELFGWYHKDFPDYKCWYVSLDDIEFISTVTNSKFK